MRDMQRDGPGEQQREHRKRRQRWHLRPGNAQQAAPVPQLEITLYQRDNEIDPLAITTVDAHFLGGIVTLGGETGLTPTRAGSPPDPTGARRPRTRTFAT